MRFADFFNGLRPPLPEPIPAPEIPPEGRVNGKAEIPSPTPELHPDPIVRGQRAQNLLADPMLKAAFEAAREKYRSDWEAAAPNDIDKQRLAHMKLHALKDVLREINQHIQGASFITETAKRAVQKERFSGEP